ncbi:MAG: hypothetical protein ABEJ68_03920 [Halobacteriaceae archaeon]
MATCTYCGSDLSDYDPVVAVTEAYADGTESLTGRFCNYACLTQHVEEEDLTAGACCQVDIAQDPS